MARAIGYDSRTLMIPCPPPSGAGRPWICRVHRPSRPCWPGCAGWPAQNVVNKSYIGTGYYDTWTPAVIQRNVLENPGWYRPYPYQPEISGAAGGAAELPADDSDLTGMDLANASMLDEGTAAAEAMTLLHRVNKRNRSDTFLVAADCHPQTIAVVKPGRGAGHHGGG